jgi:hypothetical protein
VKENLDTLFGLGSSAAKNMQGTLALPQKKALKAKDVLKSSLTLFLSRNGH